MNGREYERVRERELKTAPSCLSLHPAKKSVKQKKDPKHADQLYIDNHLETVTCGWRGIEKDNEMPLLPDHPPSLSDTPTNQKGNQNKPITY